MYDTFDCHFKPNQKSQSDMTDPVMGDWNWSKNHPFFFSF